MQDKQIEELTFNELKNSNSFSIVREHILQVSDGICAFYNHGKIRDHKTGKETYIDEDLLDVLFPMFEQYAVTQMKRKGVYDLANEKEQLREDINTDEQLKELVSKIDYNNKEQVQALKDVLKVKYPNINKLWEV